MQNVMLRLGGTADGAHVGLYRYVECVLGIGHSRGFPPKIPHCWLGQIHARISDLVYRTDHRWNLAKSISVSAVREALLLEMGLEGKHGAGKKMAQLSPLWSDARCAAN